MTLQELVSYAEEKYHIREEYKWDSFSCFSVLADPETNKWVALLMQQWDYETGTEICRCDIKCGKEILREVNAPYLANAFRMKGSKWVGVVFDDRTDPEVVFRLFDTAIREIRSGGYTVVLEEPGSAANSGKGRTANTGKAGKTYHDTLLPLEAMRGNYDKRRVKEREEEERRKASGKRLVDFLRMAKTDRSLKIRDKEVHGRRSDVVIPGSSGSGYTETPIARGVIRDAGSYQIPARILQMMQLYEYGINTFEHKCRNFYRQGKFMEDYEDDAPWNNEFRRYFATYHDLNLNQLRGFFAWRTRVRKGEFYPITASMAYMYIYELLNMIGTASPEESLRKMKEFEAGYLDAGYGDKVMRDNLHRWILEFAVLSGMPAKETISYIDPKYVERDRLLMILRKPGEHSDDEIFEALSGLTGGKIEKSSVIRKEPERGKHLYAEVWRYMSEKYEDDGWDIFTACFGKLRRYAWHPLANAVYLDRKKREDMEYKVTECHRYVYKDGEWSEIRYGELYFDKFRIHAILHEADRQIRRYLGTGSYLKQKEGEEWITPFVEAVLEADRAAVEEAKKPKITIDLSGLDKIRRDAQITRDSLLTEEEMQEQAGSEMPEMQLPEAPEQQLSESPQPMVELEAPLVYNAADSATIEVPSLDDVHAQILAALMHGRSVSELIRSNYLMPAVVADTINEALFDEIGDNVLTCDGNEIGLVEDYRLDLEDLLGDI